MNPWISLLLLVIALGGMPRTFAQFPFGVGSPGSGGIEPELSCPQPWLGRPDYQLRLRGGLGGAPALLVVSPGPASVVSGGVPINVDLSAAYAFVPVQLGGAIGVPGSGEFTLSLPLPGPANPAYAGIPFFWQAAIADPAGVGGIAVSKGLEADLVMPPLVFVGAQGSGFPAFRWWIDPRTVAPAFPGVATTSVGPVVGAVFADFGRTLWVLAADTMLSRIDVSAAQPVSTPVRTFALPGNAAAGGLQFDRRRQLVWLNGSTTGGPPELVAVDVDSTSPSFSRVVAETTTVASLVPGPAFWALSPSGTRVAIASYTPPLVVSVFDVDRSSPGFGSRTSVSPALMPTGSLLVAPVDITWSPDESMVAVLHAGIGPAAIGISRFVVSTGQFIDHDPSTASLDPLGATSVPPVPLGVAPLDMGYSRRGDALFVSGMGGLGWAGRIDLDPQNPSPWSWTPASGFAYSGGGHRISVDPDGAVVATETENPLTLHFLDASTMVSTGSVPLSSGGGLAVIAWR